MPHVTTSRPRPSYALALALIWGWYICVPVQPLLLLAVYATVTIGLYAWLEQVSQGYLRSGILWLMLGFGLVALLLGEWHNFYDTYVWFDTMLHALSGLVSGVVFAFTLAELRRRQRIHLPRWSVLVLAWCMAVTVATVWELAEAAIDLWYGLNLQPSLGDTMHDLFLNAACAVLGVLPVIGLLYKQLALFAPLAQQTRRLLFRVDHQSTME